MIARLLFLAFVLSAPFIFGACSSSSKKSTASLYDDDAPTMRYHDRQYPGGKIGTHRYH